jgi:ABC-type Co2+ transport system permease subunit
MHLPDGAISPSCAAIGFAAAAAGVGLLYLTERGSKPQAAHGWRSFAAVSLLVLGLQELQIPAPSGRFAVHLLGGVLAAWQLGALRGVAAIAGVLAVQALLLDDGSPSAYGVHLLAMGILPALCWRLLGRSPARAGAAAALSVLLAAAVVGLAAATARTVSLRELLVSHLPLVAVEALVTIAIVWSAARAWTLRVPTTVAIAVWLALAAPAGNALPDALGHALGEREAAASAFPVPLIAGLCLLCLWLLRAGARRAGELR